MYKYLQNHKWEHPDSYFGFSPDGDYVIVSRNRDADILTESNWAVAGAELKAVPYDDGNDNYHNRPPVYHWRARCSMFGWWEYLMVRKDAPADILKMAEEIARGLSAYPVLSDDDYSERQYEAIYDYWCDMSLSERIEYCEGHPFAARRGDEVPDSAFNRLRDIIY